MQGKKKTSHVVINIEPALAHVLDPDLYDGLKSALTAVAFAELWNVPVMYRTSTQAYQVYRELAWRYERPIRRLMQANEELERFVEKHEKEINDTATSLEYPDNLFAVGSVKGRDPLCTLQEYMRKGCRAYKKAADEQSVSEMRRRAFEVLTKGTPWFWGKFDAAKTSKDLREFALEMQKIREGKGQKPADAVQKPEGLPDDGHTLYCAGLPKKLKTLAEALPADGTSISTKDLAHKIDREPSRIMSDHRNSRWKEWINRHIGRDNNGLWWLKKS